MTCKQINRINYRDALPELSLLPSPPRRLRPPRLRRRRRRFDLFSEDSAEGESFDWALDWPSDVSCAIDSVGGDGLGGGWSCGLSAGFGSGWFGS